MSRTLLQHLYALGYALVTFVLVWMGQEGVQMLGPDSYIRWQGEWVDLKLYHLAPILWTRLTQELLPITIVVVVCAVLCASLIALLLRALHISWRPILGFALGALTGIGLFAGTRFYLASLGEASYPFFSAIVLSMGVTAYCLAAVQTYPNKLARLGDALLVAMSIVFSVGWFYFVFLRER